MNICDKCGYKVVSNTMFQRHLKTHENAAPIEVPVADTEVPVQVPVVEPVLMAPIEEGITIHFAKSIEVYINGIAYVGKDIQVKDMAVASEIVRIAREAYGPTILL